MTSDLFKLSKALRADTTEMVLERQIESHREAIKSALSSGLDFVLDGPPRIVIRGLVK